MDASKRALKGSKRRDAFKHWHKTLPGWYYALDIDFALINKKAHTDRDIVIIAFIEYMKPDGTPTFTECMAYNALIKEGHHVFIVKSEPFWKNIFCPKCGAKVDEEAHFGPNSIFNIYQYCGGSCKPDPPVCDLKLVEKGLSARGFRDWEGNLRHGNLNYAP